MERCFSAASHDAYLITCFNFERTSELASALT
jgi:hypothetical protein